MVETPKFKCEALNSDHLLMDFDCGRESPLTDWLINKALHYHEERLCAVWLLVTDDEARSVRGYFTLSSHTITVADVPRKDRTQEKANGPIVASLPQLPAHLLGKFAVDKSLQGTSTGKLLMMHVFKKFTEASRISGSKYLILETNQKNLVDYYRSEYGFANSTNEISSNLFRMYKKASDIEIDLSDIDWQMSAEAAG